MHGIYDTAERRTCMICIEIILRVRTFAHGVCDSRVSGFAKSQDQWLLAVANFNSDITYKSNINYSVDFAYKCRDSRMRYFCLKCFEIREFQKYRSIETKIHTSVSTAYVCFFLANW